MRPPEPEPPEDQLADALAAFDDQLAARRPVPPETTDPHVDPDLLPDWNRLRAFLSLVEKSWPRGGAGSDATTITEDRRAEPALAGGISEMPGSSSSPAEAHQQFGRFQIIRSLGQGGFGIVFLAYDPMLRRQIALKVPQPESLMTAEARKRFQREAQAAAGLDHPHIVAVYETGTVDSITYIAAAYIAGPTLEQWLAGQSRPVPARDAARLVMTLASAVEHAHERGVLHRDLKPSNILLQPNGSVIGEGPQDLGPLDHFEPRITDFSLAKLADGLGPRTMSGIPFGSPPYMAPEQAEGKLKAIGPPTDVYGLGCLLYELLTGKPPFEGESQLQILSQVIANAPVPPRRRRPELPVDLEAIVLRCLEKEPARRYAGALALAEDLDRFLEDRPTHARPLGLVARAWRWILRPERMRDAGVISMGYAVMALLWIIYGALFVRLGIVFHLQRPNEFYRDALLVALGDFVPTFWLGWKINNRRPWAIWLGLATAFVRLFLTSGGLFGVPPRFGDFYDDDMMRIAIYIALINLAVIVFGSNLMALLAYYANDHSATRS